MEKNKILEKIYELNDYSKLIERQRSCLDSDLHTLKTIINESKDDNIQSNKVIDYLAEKLETSICLKLVPKSINSEMFSTITTVTLINQLKTMCDIDPIIYEKAKVILENEASTKLESIRLIKALLKHGKSVDDHLNSIMLNYLNKNSNSFFDFVSDKTVEQTSISNCYLLNKYFKCVNLCFEKKSPPMDMNDFMESRLNDVIDSDVTYKSAQLSSNDLIYSNLYAKTLQYVVYLTICSKNDLDSIRLEKVKKRILMSDEDDTDDEIEFKPDLIYSGQIDDTQQIEFNLLCLETFLAKRHRTQFAQYLFEFNLNPNRMFLKLASSICFDCELVVEWLISNETKFLVYFLKYLKFLANDLNQFKLVNLEKLVEFSRASTKPNSLAYMSINNLFEFLSSIHAKLNSLKRSFPYNCEPLLKLLLNINNFNK